MSLFQKPDQRIRSIKDLNQTISKSKEMKEWDLIIDPEPEEINAKVLDKPQIIDPISGSAGYNMEDTSILRTLVHQPINFEKWAIFCLDRDKENARYLQDQFYNISQKEKLNIFVDYADIISLKDRSAIDEFKEAIDGYYKTYVLDRASGKGNLNFYILNRKAIPVEQARCQQTLLLPGHHS